MVALTVADVDLAAGTAVVRRGKGGKGRVVPFGAQTAQAIDRYLRVRRTHRLASTQALWLGDRGKDFTYDGLHTSLKMRAALAGVEGFHPHLLRHAAAHRWLVAGGSESGLMGRRVDSADMLLRYTKAQASARAADGARTLNLGSCDSEGAPSAASFSISSAPLAAGAAEVGVLHPHVRFPIEGGGCTPNESG